MSIRSKALSCVISSYLDEEEEREKEEKREEDTKDMSWYEKYIYDMYGGGERGIQEVERYRSNNDYDLDDDENTTPVERTENTGKYKIDIVKEIREKGFFGFLFGS